MRVSVKLQGEENAQALFDCMHGRKVRWRELGGGWHKLTFDHSSVDEAEAVVKDLYIGRYHIRAGE
ncbi:hypothetical protein ACI2US_03020 [Ralstonia nicotianae]|nr:hypothetical protein G7968_07690 [Ralstonia solanacearum]